MQSVVLGKFSLGDPLPVHKGSIMAVQIDHAHDSDRPLDHAVIAGDCLVRQIQIVLPTASDRPIAVRQGKRMADEIRKKRRRKSGDSHDTQS